MQRPSSCETLPSARNKRDNARKTGSDVLIVKQQVCKYSVLVETEQSKTCQTTWIRLPSLLLGNGPTSGDYFEENYRGWTLQAAGTASGLSLWSKGVDGRNLLKSGAERSWGESKKGAWKVRNSKVQLIQSDVADVSSHTLNYVCMVGVKVFFCQDNWPLPFFFQSMVPINFHQIPI